MAATIDASALAQLQAIFARAPDIVREELLQSVKTGGLFLQGELGQALPRGSGAQKGAGLAQSVFSEETVLADNVIGVTASQQPYALYVEIGRAPGRMPPHSPIVAWVRDKLGVPDDEVDQVAFLIRRKIATVGVEANPVWQRTLAANELQLLAIVGEGVGRTLDRITRQ